MSEVFRCVKSGIGHDEGGGSTYYVDRGVKPIYIRQDQYHILLKRK